MSGTVDVQAAFAGMPFTEVEEPERDLVEWVDQLDGGAGPLEFTCFYQDNALSFYVSSFSYCV